jgi:hypothetical protein
VAGPTDRGYSKSSAAILQQFRARERFFGSSLMPLSEKLHVLVTRAAQAREVQPRAENTSNERKASERNSGAASHAVILAAADRHHEFDRTLNDFRRKECHLLGRHWRAKAPASGTQESVG